MFHSYNLRLPRHPRRRQPENLADCQVRRNVVNNLSGRNRVFLPSFVSTYRFTPFALAAPVINMGWQAVQSVDFVSVEP
jgi:hypothetical protein